jgi:hypothetical protein
MMINMGNSWLLSMCLRRAAVPAVDGFKVVVVEQEYFQTHKQVANPCRF